jgi:hypothetical protein
VESAINKPTLEEAKNQVVEILMKKLENIDRITDFLSRKDEYNVNIKTDNGHSIDSRQRPHAKVTLKNDIIDIDGILDINLDEVDPIITDTSLTLSHKANRINKIVIC